jgi:hypothetical protein
MDYVLGKMLPFDRLSGKLIFTTDHLQLTEVNGTLLAGDVRGNADISLAHEDPRYHANLTLKGIDFPRLTDLYFQYKTAQGQLNGTYDFDGFGSDARKMHGQGKVKVTNGDVFAIPVFGPLSDLMPGIGYSVRGKRPLRSRSKMELSIPTISKQPAGFSACWATAISISSMTNLTLICA